ncbi:hypothetical protein [Nafulsella turpanensis]|uniref:hypothetical protein n=1 Tax=Nafulsella turpanensis TaxID=1265690 RepID=UPI000365207B|nr:hypothetical protein [Nafulsella turpanensis]
MAKKRINSKNKGSAYERKIINELKEWFPDAVSSRSESRSLDNQKVDVCYTDPLQVQCKAVEKSLDVHSILNSMPVNGMMNLVFHKRNNQGCIVAMKKEDFYQLLEGMMHTKTKK